MTKIVLGIYEGTTSTRIVAMNGDLQILNEVDGVHMIVDVLSSVNHVDATASVYEQSRQTEITGLFPHIPNLVEHKAVAALIAGAGRQFGVVTICDDEVVTLGVDEGGPRLWISGRGKYVDQNGAYAIGRDVLQAVCDDFDAIGGATRPFYYKMGEHAEPFTKLTERVLLRLNLHSHAELIAWLNAKNRNPEDMIPLVDEAIALETTDAVATGIISRAADRLASQAQTVALRLEMSGKRFPLIMAGSLFSRSELLRTLFAQSVQAVLPGAVPHLLTHDYAVCAGLLALDKLGVALPQLDLDQNAPPRRATERRNPLTVDIQERPTIDFARLMNTEDQRVPRLIEPQLVRIAALIDQAAERYEKGGRLFFVGAGTSGRLAVLDAAECRPTFGTTLEEIAGILAGGEEAMIHSIEGAEDHEAQGRAEILIRAVSDLDIVIGVAASGTTPFVIGAVREAQDRGALTGCIVNNAESAIAALVQHPIVVPTGPEVIMGSTRLKAGTAQKLVLNMISTGVMMRVGKTYGNLMTDMQMSNIKLRKRAAVIVAEATELPLAEAAELLERCDNEMKTAIASHLLKLSPDEARIRLQTYHGNLYRCIQRGL